MVNRHQSWHEFPSRIFPPSRVRGEGVKKVKMATTAFCQNWICKKAIQSLTDLWTGELRYVSSHPALVSTSVQWEFFSQYAPSLLITVLIIMYQVGTSQFDVPGGLKRHSLLQSLFSLLSLKIICFISPTV